MTQFRRIHRRNVNEAGHVHVLTFSCYHGYQFLKAERCCKWLAESIDNARCKLDFALWAYVFMPEHAHLIVRPQNADYDIADIRHAIKSPVGQKAIQYLAENSPKWLPRLTRNRGSKSERLFWQSGGGYDRNVVGPSTLIAEIEYVHMNPVRRGLVERADQWKWSSAGWFLGTVRPPVIPDPVAPEWCV